MNMTKKIEFTKAALKQINKIISKRAQSLILEFQSKVVVAQDLNTTLHLIIRLKKMILFLNKTIIDKNSLK